MHGVRVLKLHRHIATCSEMNRLEPECEDALLPGFGDRKISTLLTGIRVPTDDSVNPAAADRIVDIRIGPCLIELVIERRNDVFPGCIKDRNSVLAATR